MAGHMPTRITADGRVYSAKARCGDAKPWRSTSSSLSVSTQMHSARIGPTLGPVRQVLNETHSQVSMGGVVVRKKGAGAEWLAKPFSYDSFIRDTTTVYPGAFPDTFTDPLPP